MKQRAKMPAGPYHHYDASFRVWGVDIDIDQLTAATGLRPAESHRKGESRGKGRWQESLWSFRSSLPESSDLDAHLASLLDSLEPVKIKLLRALPQEYLAQFWCAHYTNAAAGFAGVITLLPQTIARLGKFGFGLAIDTYADCG